MNPPNAIEVDRSTSLPPIPPRPVYTARTTWRILLYPLIAGPAFALLTWGRLQAYSSLGGPGLPMIAAVLGFLSGLVCCPVVYLLLRNRNADYCLLRVSWSVTLLILFTSMVPVPADLLGVLLLFAAPTALLVSCAVWATRAPRVYFGIDVCRDCGYDLRGSYGSARCPECGWDFRNEMRPCSAGAEKSPRLPGRLAVALVRHPLLIVFALIAISALNFEVDRRQCQRLHRDFVVAVQSAAAQGGAIDLGQIARFDWEQAYVFARPMDGDDVAQRLGFSWPGYDRAMGVGRGRQVLAFVHKGRVVRYCVLFTHGPDGVEFAPPEPMVPTTRLFVRRVNPDAQVQITTSMPADADSNYPP